jgi:Fe-S cluster assembly protein SufD
MTTQAVMTDMPQWLTEARQAPGAVPTWLPDIRDRAAEQAVAMPLPSRKNEAWRYTSLGFLEQRRYVPGTGAPVDALELSDVEEFLLPEHKGARLVFVNGHFAPALSDLRSGMEGGVSVRPLSTLANAPVDESVRRQLDHIATHRSVFSALNSALMADGALIHVASKTVSELPVDILHISVGGEDDANICHPRHLIVVEAGASAHVIERYCSLGDSVYFNNALIEIAVGEGASLTHESLQEESPSAQHLNDLHVRLDASSRYRFVSAPLGGEWTRTDMLLRFAGEGAEADLSGLMLAGDGQLNDVHLDIRHDVPGCRSKESFKSILDGRGKVVFDGKIVVARDAQHTDAELSNHNLMLSRSAEVDTKPQLEIFADDVKCSHGTTVGELDSDMLFYLRSRGIPQDKAVRMLCQGFAQDVLNGFETEALQQRALRMLDARLVSAGTGQGD